MNILLRVYPVANNGIVPSGVRNGIGLSCSLEFVEEADRFVRVFPWGIGNGLEGTQFRQGMRLLVGMG